MKVLTLARQKKEGEQGFTMAELAIAMALSMLVLLGAAEMLRQLIVTGANGADETVAVIQVQNVGFWVGQDAIQAQAVDCYDPGIDPQRRLLVLSWVDWSDTTHEITYSVADMTDEDGRDLWELLRHDSVVDERILVADSLDPLGTSSTWDAQERVLEFAVTAMIGDEAETRTISIQPRAIQ
jgi:competence protein ComGC